ncbi:MAG: hypothetical protein B0D91_10800 [Oceanospirillales bacterium LUC14_002_19_P2]|nr:MAG: hypothetical protein B0D91_10800 [Oceanospirillales bacterium LUC14_002_19_P2]
MSDSKDALNQTDATTQDGMNLLCDGFRDQLMQNIQYLRQGDGRLVLDTLDETGQWHATQMNGFLKTLVLPPITDAIIALHIHIMEKNSTGNDTAAQASIQHGVELSDLSYNGSYTVTRQPVDRKQATLLALHFLRQQMEAIQRQTAIELADQSEDIGLIRCSMILDGLNQSLKNLIQCLLCATFPDYCNSDRFSHIRIMEDNRCLFDSLSVCPRGRNTWAPAGIPVAGQSIYSQPD